MVDREKIRADYNNLKKRGQTRLLPLEKVMALEDAKVTLTEMYLKKICKILPTFELDTDESFVFTMEEFLTECKKFFGEPNFFNKQNENNKLSIDIAFNFGTVSLLYHNEKFSYRVAIFWDM